LTIGARVATPETKIFPYGNEPRRRSMSWTTPVICEVSAGMEVTAYLAAGM